MLAAIASWFTPAILFCLMNLVIATLFLSHKKTNPEDPTRPVSLLQRVRSITLHSPYTHDPTHNPPTLLQRVRSINLSFYDQNPTQELTPPEPDQNPTQGLTPPEPDQNPTEQAGNHHRSESEPPVGTRPDPDFEEAGSAPRRMKKSASVKTRKLAVEEVRRPATVREKKAAGNGGDDEVDEKADDFINKFKQQLKLQRLDSMLRYKEMLNRGASR